MIEYNVNKKKRTVAAFIKFDEYENDRECFENSLGIYDDLGWTITRLKKNGFVFSKKHEKNKNKMIFPMYMSAKAKCSPEDEWDEDYGKALARERLVNKIHNYRSNSYKIIQDIVKEIDESLNK